MTAYTFSDVLLKPKFSDITTRSNVDTSVDFTKPSMARFVMNLPVFSSNMKDITGPSMCEAMYASGGRGILHRFNSIEEAVTDYNEAKYRIGNNPIVEQEGITMPCDVGVSIGVNITDDLERAEALFDRGARLFCIDIAHGHHIYMKEMLVALRARWGESIYIIAGNIATAEAAYDLMDWGADCLKVGIGPGSVCQTRNNTGVGVPQLYALEQVASAVFSQSKTVKVICDGGIKTTGDINKALVYADAVMVGSFIAGTSETPGHVWTDETGNMYKIYGGSASGERKVAHGKEKQFVEGIVKTVPFRGHVKYILKNIRENMQSGFSYSGARNLDEFHDNARFVYISGGGKNESKIKG